MPRRCEFGCSYLPGITFHQFPHPERNPEGFKAWVHIVGGKLTAAADTEFYRKKVICEIHFPQHFKNRNNRLSAIAVPTLHLHGDIATQLSTATESREQSASSISGPVVTDQHAARAIAAEHNYTKSQRRCQRTNVTKYKKSVEPKITSMLVAQLNTTKKQLRNLKIELRRVRQRCQTFKSRLANAEKLTINNAYRKITKNMTAAAKIFTNMQYTQTHKKPGGRRFSLEEKILSLSMYKKSPKNYKLLYNFFTLPSAKSLKRLLAKIEIKSGLNKSIFIKMKKTVKKLSKEDRLCTLIFDEMTISPQIHYDATKDELKGFAWRSKKIADHVLVYMVKGIKKNFKQPVAYFYTNCLNKDNLKSMTKKVIQYVLGAGLNILCTICDQSTINVSAINELVKETKEKYIKYGKEWKNEIIEIGKTKIIPLFDVPHLFKGVRNNLLTKNLKYFDYDEKTEKTIKWEYYQQLYEADKTYGELRMLQKLTNEHIYIEKMKKMKVKAATQVFSHSVAVAAEHLTGRGDLPSECRSIVKFTKLMDSLFDSLNTLVSKKIDSGDTPAIKSHRQKN